MKSLQKLKNQVKKYRDKYLYIRRSKFLPAIKSLYQDNPTIISSNCFAGRILQDLGKEYNTPTLGLYFMPKDYIEFLSNIRYYLGTEITFTDQSKYELGNEARKKAPHWYPIGLLDNKIEIHFLHYHSEQEAAEKWYRRAKRVNFDKLFIIAMDQNGTTEQEVKDFHNLPFEKKIFFSRFPLQLSSNEYMKEFANKESVGNPYLDGHVFYKHLVNHFK